MKKIIVFLLIFLSLKSFAQYPNGKQTLGSDSNVIEPKGGLHARLLLWRYPDTTSANLERIKQYPGAHISVGNKVYVRDSTATHWLDMSSTLSTITIINDSTFSVCNFNSCDTFYTTTNPIQSVTILDDSTLLVCYPTSPPCDTFHVPRTQFAQTLFDTTSIYNAIQNVYNFFSDTSFTNQFFPRGDGVLLDTVIRITDSTLRFIYTDGTEREDTFRIAFTQENITNITNILNYIDSVRGNDTTFILSNTNLQNGDPVLYSTTDSLSGNDTLHVNFPLNNIAEDSVLTTDVDGNLKMKLVTAGGGGTVTSVGLTSSDITVGGSASPITTSGTFTLTINHAADQTLTATSEQTAFTFSGVPTSYNYFWVDINGEAINQPLYYTKSGDVITFTSGVQLGAKVTLHFK